MEPANTKSDHKFAVHDPRRKIKFLIMFMDGGNGGVLGLVFMTDKYDRMPASTFTANKER